MFSLIVRRRAWFVALAAALAVVTTSQPAAAALPNESGWWQIGVNDPNRSRTDQSPSAAYNAQRLITMHVWDGLDGSIWYSTVGDEAQWNRLSRPIRLAFTSSAPTVIAVRNGWMVFHRGADNRIYYANNINQGLDGGWSDWQAITVNGVPVTTSSVPVAVEIGGHVTVAYHGATSNQIYTVDGHPGAGTAYGWSDNVATLQYSDSPPAIANFAGRMFLAWRDSSNRVSYATRAGQRGGWTSEGRVPNSPTTQDRPTMVASGNTLLVAAMSTSGTAQGSAITRTRFLGGPGWTRVWDRDAQNAGVSEPPTVFARNASSDEVRMMRRGAWGDERFFEKIVFHK